MYIVEFSCYTIYILRNVSVHLRTTFQEGENCMSYSSTKAKYDIEYARTKLKRVPLDALKEKYEKIKVAAGESINDYIKEAVD